VTLAGALAKTPFIGTVEPVVFGRMHTFPGRASQPLMHRSEQETGLNSAEFQSQAD
jgi:hypothetical protein